MDYLENVLNAFKDAADRNSLPLANQDLDPLTRKIAFSLSLLSKEERGLQYLAPRITLPLQISDAVRLAIELRALLGEDDIEPFLNLPTALADQLEVLLFTIERSNIAGASALFDGRAFVFVSMTSDFDALYMTARQLGHLLTMPTRAPGGIFATVEMAHENSHAPMGAYKRFADFFALELLVPTRGLGIALKEIRKLLKVSSGAIGDVELLYLARIFGVSFLAIARRCERAQLLPRGGATALHHFIVERFGGPEKRAKDLELPPRPTIGIPPIPKLVASAVGSAIRGETISIEVAASELGCTAPYLAQVLNLS